MPASGSWSLTANESIGYSFEANLNGIGAPVARRPLPHHRAYGSGHGGSKLVALELVDERRKPLAARGAVLLDRGRRYERRAGAGSGTDEVSPHWDLYGELPAQDTGHFNESDI
jgi:hypothetical protein